MKSNCTLSILVHTSQKESYKAAAKSAGMSMANWIRVNLNLAALKEHQRDEAHTKISHEETDPGASQVS